MPWWAWFIIALWYWPVAFIVGIVIGQAFSK